jgi:AcrR family transcriptional regulator
MGLNLLHRKESLILTTIDIIDELGIQKLTTREIAKRQEVSEATIFRHYRNKNELLLAVLDYFTQYDADIVESIELRQLEPLDALQYLIVSFAEYYENYPAITSILQIFDVLRYEPELAYRVKEIQNNRVAMIKELVDQAISREEINGETDSSMLAVIISGLLREQTLNWRLQSSGFSLRQRVQAMLEMILDAFRTDTKE